VRTRAGQERERESSCCLSRLWGVSHQSAQLTMNQLSPEEGGGKHRRPVHGINITHTYTQH